MLEFPSIVLTFILTFSPDGQWLASSKLVRQGGQKCHIRTIIEIWQVPRLQMVRQLPEGRKVVALAFSPDGKILASGGVNNWVSLWELPEGKREKRLVVKIQRYDGIYSLAFSPDGRLLAAGTRYGSIYLWQMPQGRLFAILPTDNVTNSLAFSPDGRKLVALVNGKQFQVWDVQAKKLLWEQNYEKFCFSATFTKDGRRLVGVGYGFLVLSAVNGSVIKEQNLSPFHALPGSISADGEFVAFYDDAGSVMVRRTSDFKETWRGSIFGWKLRMHLHQWAHEIEKRTILPATNLFPYPRLPFALGFAFSRDNRWLALGFEDGQIKLWRIH